MLEPGEVPGLERIQAAAFNRRARLPAEGEGGAPSGGAPSGGGPSGGGEACAGGHGAGGAGGAGSPGGRRAWGAFEGGRLLSCMWDIDFRMSFDGGMAKMAGAGGVATLPEARRRGLARKIFEKMLPEAYEAGAVFSCLTPFSHEYYRAFGYEICCARANVSIPSRELLAIRPGGEYAQVFPGGDVSELRAVHSAYIAGLNHGICRDLRPGGAAWSEFAGSDPYSTGIFLYVWRDGAGRPRSYLKYRSEACGEGHAMEVVELAFDGREGLFGALGLAGALSPQFGAFRWPMPAFLDPFDFAGSAWDVGVAVEPRDMTRVVSARAALSAMRRPEGEGEYVIEIEDAFLPANSGRLLVEFGAGESRVSPTRRAPDLRCDAPSLSQIVTGYRSLEGALLSRRSGIELCGRREAAARAFTLRPQHVTESF